MKNTNMRHTKNIRHYCKHLKIGNSILGLIIDVRY